jgi:hypothetical protein
MFFPAGARVAHEPAIAALPEAGKDQSGMRNRAGGREELVGPPIGSRGPCSKSSPDLRISAAAENREQGWQDKRTTRNPAIRRKGGRPAGDGQDSREELYP